MKSKWRQKCSLLQVIEPLTEKTWGRGCVIFSEQKKQKRNGKTPLRTGEYFEWIIKQLLNLAFVGYEEFCRSRWITPSEILRILHILRKPNSIIAYNFFATIAANLAIWFANLQFSIRVIPRCSRQCVAKCLFDIVVKKRTWIISIHGKKKKFKIWFIVVCTLIDN